MKLLGLTSEVSLDSSAKSAEAFTLLRPIAFAPACPAGRRQAGGEGG